MSETTRVRLRMGIHNRITAERFQAIKNDINDELPIAKIAKRHNVSDSTVRKVRRSKDFHEYRIRADEQVHSRRAVVVVSPVAGVPFEDFGRKPIFSSPKISKDADLALSDRLDRESENTAKCLGLVLLGIIGVLSLAFVAILIIGASK